MFSVITVFISKKKLRLLHKLLALERYILLFNVSTDKRVSPMQHRSFSYSNFLLLRRNTHVLYLIAAVSK